MKLYFNKRDDVRHFLKNCKNRSNYKLGDAGKDHSERKRWYAQKVH